MKESPVTNLIIQHCFFLCNLALQIYSWLKGEQQRVKANSPIDEMCIPVYMFLLWKCSFLKNESMMPTQPAAHTQVTFSSLWVGDIFGEQRVTRQQ